MKTRTIFALCFVMLISSCAQKYDRLPLTDSDQEFREMLQESIRQDNSFDARLQLATLLFEYNHITEANTLLENLTYEQPDSMEALAWYGANKCKIVRESQPWLLGIRKLSRVKSCLAMVKTALDTEPKNFTVQLVAINTGSLVNMNNSLEWATQARESLNNAMQEAPNKFPPSVTAYFKLAAAENELAFGNIDNAKNFLEDVISQNSSDRLSNFAAQRLSQLK